MSACVCQHACAERGLHLISATAWDRLLREVKILERTGEGRGENVDKDFDDSGGAVSEREGGPGGREEDKLVMQKLKYEDGVATEQNTNG